MGSSICPLLHLLSHGCVQTLPQTDGNGFSCRIRLYASLILPAAMSARYPGTFTFAGHAFSQGEIKSSEQTPALQCLYFICSSYSSLKYLIVLNTGFGAVCPSPQRAVSLIDSPSSTSSSTSPSL